MKFTTSIISSLAISVAFSQTAQARGLRSRSTLTIEEPPELAFLAKSASSNACTATLIAKDIILTGSSCVSQFKSGIVIGGAVTRQVAGRAESGDVMLLKLNEPVENFPPVRFQQNEPFPGPEDALTVMGYGAIRDNEIRSDPFSEVVKAGDHATCSSLCGGTLNFETHLCVTGQETIFFYPNVGGPIVNEDNILVGMKPFGGDCGREKNVYIRINQYSEWISERACAMSETEPAFCQPEHPTEGGNTGEGGEGNPKDGEVNPMSTCSDSNVTTFEGGCTSIAESPYLCGIVGVALECPVSCGVCEVSKQVQENHCESDMPEPVYMGDVIADAKECSWLANLLSVYEHANFLCERTEVAFHCPKTCQVCGEEAPEEM